MRISKEKKKENLLSKMDELIVEFVYHNRITPKKLIELSRICIEDEDINQCLVDFTSYYLAFGEDFITKYKMLNLLKENLLNLYDVEVKLLEGSNYIRFGVDFMNDYNKLYDFINFGKSLGGNSIIDLLYKESKVYNYTLANYLLILFDLRRRVFNIL